MIMFFAEEGGEVQDFVSPLNFSDYPYFCMYPGHWQTMKRTLMAY